MIKYSVIIPVYNVETYLEQCLESIIMQEYSNYEIILINDGSNDDSETICQEYSKRYDFIRFFSKQNEGVSSSRNLGIEMAQGKYLIFVDADDFIEKDFFEIVEKNIGNCDLLIYGYYKAYINKKEILKPDANWSKKQIILNIYNDERVSGYLWNKIFKHDIIKKYNIRFSKEIDYSEDLLFVSNYIKYIQSFYILEESIYNYRMRSNSVTIDFYNKKNISSLESLDRIILNNKDDKYIYNSLVYKYLKNYYRLRKIIKTEEYKVNTKYLKKEKEIVRNKGIKEKMIFYIIKYNLGLYFAIKRIKMFYKKYYK